MNEMNERDDAPGFSAEERKRHACLCRIGKLYIAAQPLFLRRRNNPGTSHRLLERVGDSLLVQRPQ